MSRVVEINVPLRSRFCANGHEHYDPDCILCQDIRRWLVSFAWGNIHLDNPNVTREVVDKAFDDLYVRKFNHRTWSPPVDYPVIDSGS